VTGHARSAPAQAGLPRAGLAHAGLAGTGALTRLALRRDRFMLPAWIYLIAVGVASTAYTLKKLYPTAAARAQFAVTGGGNPALRFLYGRLYGSSIGALTAWRYGIWAAIFGALMTIFIVIRHTRGDEEAGRLELVGSVAVGRQAALTAGLVTAVTANLAIAVLLGIALPLTGLPAAGSAAIALAIGASGLAFTGVAGVAAQLAARARGARGIAFGVLGGAFLLRAVGDSAASGGPSWLSWASPLGWVELTRPFGGPRWWVLVLPLAALAAGTGAAYALAARRDYGAGLLADRPGRATASGWLRGPLGLAWRLQRGTLGGWAAGVACVFAVSGAAAQGIGSLLGSSTQLRDEFTRLGGQSAITNAYLAALMLLAGLAAAGYATSTVLGLRAAETSGLAEPLLATTAGRLRWGLAQLAVAAGGTAVLLAVAGLAAGLGYGLRTGAAGPQAGRMLGAALVQLPAALTVAGVAVALTGLWPGASVPGAWTVLGAVVVIDLFGQGLQLSHWVLDVSPFTHVPRLPGGPVSAVPLLWLGLAAVVLGAVGLAALRRRDIG
jgi:ABC-2 type transport system permease protein